MGPLEASTLLLRERLLVPVPGRPSCPEPGRMPEAVTNVS